MYSRLVCLRLYAIESNYDFIGYYHSLCQQSLETMTCVAHVPPFCRYQSKLSVNDRGQICH
ncbi:hypothetical protein RO3G_03361 [Rhizopus delemar RA 99-880]|uniref:Uncharacterized protein n=1 Tax=Rhizopus delemar (strain RA 99-880 / ATCC MYA-4621 / FGSC 9543 / NRRL 43880) TaxID=246409 RepID=I1BR27_RHIO9|nr:hypothetical protein RO3G_03361 [Rhizopus delemar RA 99-880]|eukprot:EIE78657.1 hypothetical protein RO3G_03361 [Rhizopus delemar RA 99-880]